MQAVSKLFLGQRNRRIPEMRLIFAINRPQKRRLMSHDPIVTGWRMPRLVGNCAD